MQIQELADRIAGDPALKAQLAHDPEGVLKTVAATAPLQSDVHIYRLVVVSLGLCVILSVAGAIVLSFFERPVPAEATALGSAAVGALAGLLAPSPRQR